MLCHCACKHVRLSCVLNKLLTYLLSIAAVYSVDVACIIGNLARYTAVVYRRLGVAYSGAEWKRHTKA